MKNKIAYFCGRCLFCGIGLSHLIVTTGTSFWISGILGTLIGLLVLIFIKKVNSNKIVKTVSGLVLIIMSCSILVNMGHTLYLKNTPVLILTLVPVFGAFLISKSKNEPYSKILTILFVYSIFTFICKMLSLAPYAEFENLYPMFQCDFMTVISSALAFALTGVVPIICLTDISDKRGTVISYLISMLTVITIGFLIVTVIGVNGASLYRYPEYVVLKRIKILNFISNVDNIFTFALVVDLIMTMSASWKNINSKNKKTDFVYLVLITFTVFFIVEENWPLIIFFDYFPVVLIILLILTIIPKKRYKILKK